MRERKGLCCSGSSSGCTGACIEETVLPSRSSSSVVGELLAHLRGGRGRGAIDWGCGIRLLGQLKQCTCMLLPM